MEDFKFANYLVFMFLSLALLGVLASLGTSMLTDYDIETTDSFQTYIEAFDTGTYADENLDVDKSDSSSGDFSEYEASFQFGDNVKQTVNQTDVFVEESVKILGLPSYIIYIITGVIGILLIVAVIFFLRGLNQ